MGNENAEVTEIRKDKTSEVRRRDEALCLLEEAIALLGRDKVLDLICEIRRKKDEEAWTGPDRMIFLPGPGQDSPETRRSFRCDCTANVFRQDRFEPLRYRCNGCGAIYTGEK